MALFLLWAHLALAGTVYVNGRSVDPVTLASVKIQDAEVSFDQLGNIFINAPGIRLAPSTSPAPTVAPVTRPAPVGTTPAAIPRPTHPTGVPRAAWWLATEDNGSVGHRVDIYLNGELAQTVRSGDPQRIADISGHLKLGANAVLVRCTSTQAAGGTLYVYLGTGNDKGGTVVMDAPQVQFGAGPDKSGVTERSFSLDVTPGGSAP